MRTRRDAIRRPANAEEEPSRQDGGFEFEFIQARFDDAVKHTLACGASGPVNSSAP
jgi:hypothetical protein